MICARNILDADVRRHRRKEDYQVENVVHVADDERNAEFEDFEENVKNLFDITPMSLLQCA